MVSRSQKKGLQIPFSKRHPAIDAMRGLVMVLMALDHVSHVINAGRYVSDSAAWYVKGSTIPAIQFLMRWVTHICAPTFLFLAGFVLVLSVARRQSNGEPNFSIDTYLLKRGTFIFLLDPLWMSIVFGEGILLQVLYAIGASFCCMTFLRRIGDVSLLAFCLALFLFSQLLVSLSLWSGGGQMTRIIGALLITGGPVAQHVYVLYSLLPWLAYMILGWIFGKFSLQKTNFELISFLLKMGVVSLLVFVAVRGLNGYGNMGLLRDDLSLLQWLHVSKYPPSLSFAALELGLMFFLMALFYSWYNNRPEATLNPLLVFGRTPLYFYVIHVHLITIVAWLFGKQKAASLSETFVATVLVLVMLYPLCRWYLATKKNHPNGILRYL